MNPNEAIEAARNLAMQNDRVLFIASLALIITGGTLAIRWLLKQNAEIVKDHREAKEKYTAWMLDTVKDSHAILNKLAVLIDSNTKAMNAVSDEARLLREVTREMRREK